ncbi:MAG: hypothetical protein HZA50_07675 [Planctomycetes bacterium]|nr:hypothetical protein [Planctomycetota bacterium]
MANVIKAAGAIVGRIVRRPAYMFLTARQETLDAQPPERFKTAWLGLLMISVAWAVLARELWWLSWRFLDGFLAFPVRTPAIIAAVILLWPMRHSLSAAASLTGGRAASGGPVAILIYIALAGGLMFLPNRNNFSEPVLPDAIAWLRPDVLQYRVVILMPIWGWWAMLIVGKFCRAPQQACPAVAAMARGTGPLIAAAGLALPMLLTALYFSHLGWRHLAISGCCAAAALAGGIAVCKLMGGLCRNALVAANLLTQFALLGSCLICYALYPA